jgi:hypothetical protein
MGEPAWGAELAEAAAPLPETAKSVAELIAATGGGVNAIFDFQHKVFALPGARFAVDRQSRATMFHIHLGSLGVALTPTVLRREFSIQVLSHDSQLIELASHALRHVKEIRPGDSVPRELVDGSASWSVEERHLLIAKAKLLAQVGGWLGEEGSAISVESILALTELDVAAKEDFQKAFARIAQALGIDRNRKQEIVDHIDAVARELCYIEALREYAGQFRTIHEKVSELAHLAKGDPAISEEVGRVLILLKPALTEFAGRFARIDAQTGDLHTLLRNPWSQIRSSRDARDEIHSSLLPWSDIFARWKDQEVVMNHIMDENIHALYALLAANYAPSRIWR